MGDDQQGFPTGQSGDALLNLIARFWDVTEGEISISGVNIKDIPLLQLADTVSFVTQDNFLFRCSKIIRAMAMRCFSPPDSRLPASPAGVS